MLESNPTPGVQSPSDIPDPTSLALGGELTGASSFDQRAYVKATIAMIWASGSRDKGNAFLYTFILAK
jgi:hypothetical protein